MNVSSYSNLTNQVCYCENGICDCCVPPKQTPTPPKPQLNCTNGSQSQHCSCKNVTNGTQMSWSCNCTRMDTGITKNFTLAKDSCMCNTTVNESHCDCCVTKNQSDTQVPPPKNLTCDKNSAPQTCQCKNMTNATTKATYL
jgi:hypothetical protein